MNPASWPGAGIEASTPHMAAAPAVGDVLIEPKKERPVFFWTCITILTLAVCIVTGLLAWEKIQQRVQRLRAERAARTQMAAPNSSRPLVPSLKVDPMEELNARVQTGAAMAETDRLIKLLFNSATPGERLKAIASPLEFQNEVAAFFDDSPKKPALVALTPITNPPLSLVSRERLPMFKVVTTVNRAGALVRTVPDGSGGMVIDWPLFYETHDGLLARHIGEKSREPRWFNVGLRRTHSFDVSKEVSSEFDAIDIDGSTDGSGRVVTYVARESPLGRHFARHLEWSKFYFGRVLVSWMDIAGEMRPALLDCEGSMLPAEAKAASSK